MRSRSSLPARSRNRPRTFELGYAGRRRRHRTAAAPLVGRVAAALTKKRVARQGLPGRVRWRPKPGARRLYCERDFAPFRHDRSPCDSALTERSNAPSDLGIHESRGADRNATVSRQMRDALVGPAIQRVGLGQHAFDDIGELRAGLRVSQQLVGSIPAPAAGRAAGTGGRRASSPTSRAMLVSCIATPRSQARASAYGRATPISTAIIAPTVPATRAA